MIRVASFQSRLKRQSVGALKKAKTVRLPTCQCRYTRLRRRKPLDKLDFVEGKSVLPTEEPKDVLWETLPRKHLHLVVKPPAVAEITVRTKMPENESRVLLTTPEKGLSDVGTRKEAIDSFLEELRPKIKEFLTHPRLLVWKPPETVDPNTRQFYHNLAIPKINDKPNLLLHNLSSGTNPNVENLFQNGPDHRILCNTPGAGKTALLFNGLYHHWGFYFVAAQDTNKIGANDLELAIDIMGQSLEWTPDAFENPMNTKNPSSANETIAFK